LFVMARERIDVLRRRAAGLASMILAGRILSELHSRGHVDWREGTLGVVLVGAPTVAAVLVWSGRLGLHLLARAVWWVFLIVGLCVALPTGAQDGGGEPAFIIACAGAALLAIGPAGLRGEDLRFKPVAFRGTLQLSLVLAIANAAALSFLAVAFFLEWPDTGLWPKALGLAAFTGLGVVGLLRLRTWGLIVAIASSLLLLVSRPPLFDTLGGLFLVTTSMQLIVLVPMIVRLVLRRGPPPDRWHTFRSVGAKAAIVGLVALGLYAGLVRDTPLLPRVIHF
jgi:hypothetical protein